MTSTEQGTLNNEGKKLEAFLKDKRIFKITRHKEKEVVLEFEDWTRLFIDWIDSGLEFSITEK